MISSQNLDMQINSNLINENNESDIDDSQSELSDEEEVIEEELINNEEKKKRGRKPKKKDESINEDEKIPKKRGRKPKIKDETIVVDEKIPKKRGRKPKEKVYSVKELPKTFFQENKNETLILHLPLKPSEIQSNSNPLPDINKGSIDYSIYDEDWVNYKINDLNLLPTQSNLLENENVQNILFNSDNFSDLKIEPKNKNDNLVFNNNVCQNSNTNNIIENDNENFNTNKVIKKNLRNILYEFINSNNDKTWPSSTNIHCWWCCHQFTCVPCALPEYYKKEKFYVSGVFCSFNCAASYNFSKNNDNIWEKFSLLNLMYKKLYDKKFVKISLAPPRESLKIFGGYLSIEEFRDNSLRNEKTFSLITPPLISIIPKIEENISNNAKNTKTNYPLINENILNKTQNTLKLKRNKPVTNPNNTLQSFMDLKIV